MIKSSKAIKINSVNEKEANLNFENHISVCTFKIKVVCKKNYCCNFKCLAFKNCCFKIVNKTFLNCKCITIPIKFILKTFILSKHLNLQV